MARSRLLACIALSVISLAAAACGGGGGGDQKTLTIAAWDTGQPDDPLDTAVRDFERARPGVEVTVRKTAYAQYAQTLSRRLGAGQAPDLARTVLGYGEVAAVRTLAGKGLVADLSGASWAREIPAVSAHTTNDDGRTYAFPVDSTVIGAIYDPAVFEKTGLAVPRTFADVLAICRGQAGSGRTPIALGAAQESGMPLFMGFALAASTAYADDPGFAERRLAGGATFAGSPGWARALERFERLRDAGCFGKDAAAVSQETAAAALARGEALMAIAPNVTLPLFQAANPEAGLRMFAFPGGDDPASVRVPYGPISGLVVPAKAGNPELARDFIDFYARHRARYSAIDDSIVSVPEAGGDPGLPDYAEALAPYVTGGRTVTIQDTLWPNPEVRTRFAAGLVRILLGQGDAAGVLTSMDAVWTSEPPK